MQGSTVGHKDLTVARNYQSRPKRNIDFTKDFSGSSEHAETTLDKVRVERLRVNPASHKALPSSYAVIAKALEWQSLPASKFALNLKWVHSAESRWDFKFDLPEGARCLGLGERLSGLNLRGRIHTLFNTDDDSHIESIDHMYKAIPLLIIEQEGKYTGLFLDSPARQQWNLDVELENEAYIQLLSRRGWDLYIIGPATLPAIVAAYTTLTGRSNLPPRWALGHQQSRWSYPDEETVEYIASEFRKRKIPCDTIVLDIDYMNEYRVFTSSSLRFPNFKKMIEKLHSADFKVVTIVDPGVKVDDKYSVYKEGIKQKFFCETASGKPFVGEVWPGASVFPDFLRKDVRDWWGDLHRFYMDAGVDGIWNDMNEPAIFGQQKPITDGTNALPPDEDQMFQQKLDGEKVGHYEVRNLYGATMIEATYEGLRKLQPNHRPFVLTRAGYAGLQRYSAVWLGDNYSWWSHLARSIPMLLNMGLSGVPFAGVDVGGFAGQTTAELVLRWYQVGIFYPFFRNHCWMYAWPQEPWAFNEDVEKHCRKLIEWRYRLLPYIQNLFYDHLHTGAPLMRPLSWHYPNDREAVECDDQFMFGENILVAPILERGKTARPVYLPEGLWHPIEGGKPLEGGRLHNVSWALDAIPAFVKDGSIIPLSDVMQSTVDYDKTAITFRCYGTKCDGILYDDDGISFGYQKGDFSKCLLHAENGKLIAKQSEGVFKNKERQYHLQWQECRTPADLR